MQIHFYVILLVENPSDMFEKISCQNVIKILSLLLKLIAVLNVFKTIKDKFQFAPILFHLIISPYLTSITFPIFFASSLHPLKTPTWRKDKNTLSYTKTFHFVLPAFPVCLGQPIRSSACTRRKGRRFCSAWLKCLFPHGAFLLGHSPANDRVKKPPPGSFRQEAASKATACKFPQTPCPYIEIVVKNTLHRHDGPCRPDLTLVFQPVGLFTHLLRHSGRRHPLIGQIVCDSLVTPAFVVIEVKDFTHDIRFRGNYLKFLAFVDDVSIGSGTQPFAVCLSALDDVANLSI